MDSTSAVPTPNAAELVTGRSLGWRIHGVIAVTGMVMIATIFYALKMGEYIGTEHAQGLANLAQARYHAVSAHLWLEEFNMGDAAAQGTRLIRGHLEDGRRALRSIRARGDFAQEGKAAVARSLDMLEQMRVLAERRFSGDPAVASDPGLASAFDAAFLIFLESTDTVERVAREEMEADLGEFRRIQTLLMLGAALLMPLLSLTLNRMLFRPHPGC